MSFKLWLRILFLLVICTRSLALNSSDISATPSNEQSQKIINSHWWTTKMRRCFAGVPYALKWGAVSAATYYFCGADYTFAQMIAGGTIMMQIFPGIKAELEQISTAIWPDETSEIIDKFALKLALHDKPLSAAALTRASDLVRDARLKIDSLNYFEDKQLRKEVKSSIDVLELIFALPTEAKSWKHREAQVLEQLSQNMGETYDEYLVDNLKKFIMDGAQGAALFLGPPDTGKGSTALLLANILELPFYRISLCRIDLNALSESLTRNDVDIKQRIGLIAQCFLTENERGKVTNPVIYFEAIEDALDNKNKDYHRLKAIIYDILDMDNSIFDNTLGMQMDISNAILIFSCTCFSEDSRLCSLNQYFKIFKFPKVTPEARVKIANKELALLAAENNIVLNQEDDEVLKEILNRDANDGVGVLKKVIKSYISHKIAVEKGLLANNKFDVIEEFLAQGGIANMQ